MRKGDIDYVAAAFIFVGVIATLLLLLQSGFVKTSAVRVTAQDQLDSIDTAHLVKGCLEEEGIVREERLAQVGSTLHQACGLPPAAFVTVRDIENPTKVWTFGKTKKGEDHTIAIPLQLQTGEIHVGEITAVI